ncbi:A/G-specific adenine glycosylase [Pseudohyphozyma bogoriensis]|nr:A/G-specific adenine glycosylase [Pseudohyphozyma bogoriensis]
MAPKSSAASSSSRSSKIAPPNASHPAARAGLIDAALSSRQHAHPASYHSFISSKYLSPPTSSSSARGKRPPPSPLAPPLPDAIPASVVQERLIRWFEGVKTDRGMPWRKDVDARIAEKDGGMTTAQRSQRGYEVWVSEIMLQQTQVAAVIPYYNRWLTLFPTIASLASASDDAVNSAWKGLGYYSRAKRLLEGAKRVQKEFKGRMPETVEDLLKVDGIGPYSAGAISSIAFGKRAPMVDGNVTRVLSPNLDASPPVSATDINDKPLLNPPGTFNQALMELGATVCTPRNPDCGSCCLKDVCLGYAEVRAARAAKPTPTEQVPVADIEDLCTVCTPFDPSSSAFEVTQYPQSKEKKAVREEETVVGIVEWTCSTSGESKDGSRKVLLVKRPEKGLLAGLWEFPALDLPTTSPSTPASRSRSLQSHLSSLIPTLPPLTPSSSPPTTSPTLTSTSSLGSVLQVYSHQKRLYHITRLIFSSPCPPILSSTLTTKAKWVDATQVEDTVTGGAAGKCWAVRNGKKPEGFGVLLSNLGKGGPGKKAAAGGTKKANGGTAKRRRKDRSSEEEAEESDDGWLVSDDEEVEVVRKKAKKTAVKVVEEVSVVEVKTEEPRRKRPVIVVSDSESE